MPRDASDNQVIRTQFLLNRDQLYKVNHYSERIHGLWTYIYNGTKKQYSVAGGLELVLSVVAILTFHDHTARELNMEE